MSSVGNRSDVSKMMLLRRTLGPAGIQSSSATSLASASSGGSSARGRSMSQKPVGSNATSGRSTAAATQGTTTSSNSSSGMSAPNSQNSGRRIKSEITGVLAASLPPGIASGTSDSVPGGKSKKQQHFGLWQMKCLEILKKATEPLHIQEIQVALGSGYPVAYDNDFLAFFRRNRRVIFDPETKRWVYQSPYLDLCSKEAICEHIRRQPLEISAELLDHNPNIVTWIEELLSERAVRAIRGARTGRCKIFSSDSGLHCSLYDPANQRCDSCRSLHGVTLHEKKDDLIAGAELDYDLKELWHSIANPTAAELAVIRGATRRLGGSCHVDSEMERKVKRRKPAAARGPRVQKIANLHLYDAIDFSEAVEGGDHVGSTAP